MSDFRMPSLGADMEAGTLVQWLKHPGDTLKRGDIIAVVDTQKGAIEIEVFEDGVLAETLVAPGHEVPVGTVLARIRTTGDTAALQASAQAAAPAPGTSQLLTHTPSGVPAAAPTAAPAQVTAAAQTLAPSRTGLAPDTRVTASPAARALATELHVDLAEVTGTGEGGAITRDDVQRAAHGSRPAPAAAGSAERMGGMRTAIAAAMTRAKREIPHYYLSTTIDMSRALDWLRQENQRRPVTDRLLPAALLVKSVALALGDVPELNGYWTDGAFRGEIGRAHV